MFFEWANNKGNLRFNSAIMPIGCSRGDAGFEWVVCATTNKGSEVASIFMPDGSVYHCVAYNGYYFEVCGYTKNPAIKEKIKIKVKNGFAVQVVDRRDGWRCKFQKLDYECVNHNFWGFENNLVCRNCGINLESLK